MSDLSLFRRILRNLSHTLLATCVFGGAALAAEPSVLDMLMRMQSAAQTLNYQGTLVYLQNGQMQSMRVVHRADQDGEVERLISLNGVAREIVRKNDVVTCYMPDRKAVTVGQQPQFRGNLLSQLAENDFAHLQDYYLFELEAVERVAGQAAQRVWIRPKDSARYGYRLWLDEQTAILLKSDLLDEQGRVLEQTMFADIRIGDDIPDVMLAPVSRSDNFTWFEHERVQDEQKLVDSRWTIVDLPQGFSVTTRFNQQMPNSKGPAEHWVISDGLANVSIYIEPVPNGQSAFEGASAMGATNAFGAVKEAHQITVIGEVPGSTVEKLARALLLKTQ